MKNSLFAIAIVITIICAIATIFYFVQPILVLTLRDVFTFIFFDVLLSFLLALYLGYEKGKNMIAIWTIIGIIFIPIPIIASILKYNKEKGE